MHPDKVMLSMGVRPNSIPMYLLSDLFVIQVLWCETATRRKYPPIQCWRFWWRASHMERKLNAANVILQTLIFWIHHYFCTIFLWTPKCKHILLLWSYMGLDLNSRLVIFVFFLLYAFLNVITDCLSRVWIYCKKFLQTFFSWKARVSWRADVNIWVSGIFWVTQCLCGNFLLSLYGTV